MPSAVATSTASLRSFENDENPSTSSRPMPASSTARTMTSRASWNSLRSVICPHLRYSDSAIPTMAARSRNDMRPPDARRLYDSGGGEIGDRGGAETELPAIDLVVVLAEERRPPRETPRRLAGDERAARVRVRGVHLLVMDADEEPAIVEVLVVESLVGRAHRRPREPACLPEAVDL